MSVPHATLVRERRRCQRAHTLEVAKIGYGVESIRHDLTARSIEYVNLGDTYDTTICRIDGRYVITSWGAWFESEDARAARSGWYRCPNCGTANHRAKRRRLNCESCDYPIIERR